MMKKSINNKKIKSLYKQNILKIFNPSTMSYGEIVLDITELSLCEGSTVSFSFSLATKPSANQTIQLSCDNENIQIIPNEITFTPENYNIERYITLTALEDDDASMNTSVLTLSNPYMVSKKIILIIDDNDLGGSSLITDGLIFNLGLKGKKDVITENVTQLVDSVSNKIFIASTTIEPTQWEDNGLRCPRCRFDCTNMQDLVKGLTEVTIELLVNKLPTSLFHYGNGYAELFNKGNFNVMPYCNTSGELASKNGYQHNFYDELGVARPTAQLIDVNGIVHIFAIFKSNGIGELWINGYKASITHTFTDFKDYSKIFGNDGNYTRIRFDQGNDVANSSVFSAMRIYDRALSENEIKNNVTYEKGGMTIETIEILPQSMQVKKNYEVTPLIKITPSTITDDTQVTLSVNENGVVSGRNILANKLGNMTVSATGTYHENDVATQVTYEVVEDITLDNIPASQRPSFTGIVIGNPIDELKVGDEYILKALLTPHYPTYDNLVRFKSSNPNICDVKYGVVKGISSGTAVITAMSLDESVSCDMQITIVEEVQKELSESEIYVVDASVYNLSLDNTNPIETTNGIKNALAYASGNGYKKVIFPKGEYLTSIYVNEEINDEIYTNGNIMIPSNLIVDFNSSTINIDPVNSKTIKYSMFGFTNGCKNSKIINATIWGEKETMSISPNLSEEHTLCVVFYEAENCGLENCTIGKSNGFNIQSLRFRKQGTDLIWIFQDNIEAGTYDDNGVKNDENIYYNWRTINKLDVSGLGETFQLGHIMYYSGFMISARLYDAIWYDENDDVITVNRNILQFYSYPKPKGAKYLNLVFHQEAQPTGTGVGDYTYMISMYTLAEPADCFIRNCIIRDNHSTGIAMCGGRNWLMEGNTFINNQGRDPSGHVDYEDGWDSMVGDIWRNNIFEKGGNGFMNIAGQDIAVHNNIFNNTHYDQRVRSQGFRIYNNVFNNCYGVKFESQSDAIVAENILYQTTLTVGDTYHGDAALYSVILSNNIEIND